MRRTARRCASVRRTVKAREHRASGVQLRLRDDYGAGCARTSVARSLARARQCHASRTAAASSGWTHAAAAAASRAASMRASRPGFSPAPPADVRRSRGACRKSADFPPVGAARLPRHGAGDREQPRAQDEGGVSCDHHGERADSRCAGDSRRILPTSDSPRRKQARPVRMHRTTTRECGGADPSAVCGRV